MFTYGGRPYRIDIGEVVAYPQAYAAAMTKYSEVKQYTKARVIDIGGFTLDFLELKNGVPNMEVCDTLENGVITLYNQIKSRVNSEFDLLLSEPEIDDIIQRKKIDYDVRVQQLVRRLTKRFGEDMLGALRERGLDLRTGCVVFVGGGALLLREYLEQSDKVGKAIFIEDITANARGYASLYNLSKSER